MTDENSVSLGFIHSGSVRVEFMISVMNVINHPAIGNFSNSSAGPLIALARNNLAARFLDRGKEDWLWCLDTDIVFAPDTIDRLLAAADPVERPIVSALYYTIWDGHRVATIYQDSPAGEGLFNAPREFDDNKLTEVGGTGAGCLLIHRSVLEKLLELNDGDECWFREMVINRRVVGEDLSFAIRARQAGFPVHIHTGIKVGHVKSIMFGEVS